MKVLITSATGFESASLRKAVSANTQNSVQFEFAVTGIGMMHTAFNLGSILSSSEFSLVINIGVAGALDPNIRIADVVNISEEYMADLGAEDDTTFLDVFDLGLMDENEFPYSGKKLVNPHNFPFPSLNTIPKVNSISVNKAHGNSQSIERLLQKVQPQVENMEGAAFMYACLKNEIPFLQIRAISNKVEKRNKQAWELQRALSNLHDFILVLLQEVQTSAAKEGALLNK